MRYIDQARKLLQFFAISPHFLQYYREKHGAFVQLPIVKPKREYCTLTWQQIQAICIKTRAEANPPYDSIIGRAVLTLAFTTGARVGCLLQNKYGPRKDLHVPILRCMQR